MEKGSRVGAISSANSKEVKLYGYGIFDGNHKPTVPFMGIPADQLPDGLKNPRILLDNGKTVWGCECWWGSEESIKKEIGDRVVIVVDPPEYGSTE